jgi:hypothetical protein
MGGEEMIGMGRMPEHLNPLDRFNMKWTPEPNTGCSIWLGTDTKNGYGLFWVNNKFVYAHRYAYEQAKGTIPKNMCIDHLCRNRACVNPDHLEVVTFRENILRGISPAANHARQTHCLNGHELTGNNTKSTVKPAIRGGETLTRECIICSRARRLKWVKKQTKGDTNV